MTTLNLRDRCNVGDDRRSPDLSVTGDSLVIEQDLVRLDGEVVLHRIEPHGFGDVHWELDTGDDPSFTRYTDIEVLP